jgi:predicted nucleic acid-binding protein
MEEPSSTARRVVAYLSRLRRLRSLWSEIQPTEEVRDTAERLLGSRKLRSADALQLAAALIWTDNLPRDRHFVAADGALLLAAKAEGFTAVSIDGK